MFEDFGQEQHWRSPWFSFEPSKEPKKIMKTGAKTSESSKAAEAATKETTTVAQIPPAKTQRLKFDPAKPCLATSRPIPLMGMSRIYHPTKMKTKSNGRPWC
jgi:hypothetical protein